MIVAVLASWVLGLLTGFGLCLLVKRRPRQRDDVEAFLSRDLENE